MGESVLPALRASDGDRDRVASVLREHAVSGRLTLEELAERLDRTVIGDTTVIVPETIEVEVTGLTIIGETHERVRDTPRPGAPLVRLRILSLIGDVTVRTG